MVRNGFKLNPRESRLCFNGTLQVRVLVVFFCLFFFFFFFFAESICCCSVVFSIFGS